MAIETVPADARSPSTLVRELATQYFVSRALHAITELDVATCLGEHAQSVERIARQVGANEDALYRVLRALASVGVFEETTPRVFANTPASCSLIAGQDGSMRDLVLLFGDITAWRSWEFLSHTLRSGEPAFEHVYGKRIFDYLADDPEAARMFDKAMASGTALTNSAVLGAYDFRDVSSLVDVAGGIGAALVHVLKAYPNMRGIVFDMHHVAERARASISAQGLAARCEFVGGNVFEEVPAGADAYFLKHVLHDWGDDDCLRILRVCHAACRPDSRLLICERPVPEANVASSAKWIDLHMMLSNCGGRERTLAEYEALLCRAGYALRRTLRTGTPWCLLEALPVAFS